MGTPHRIIKAIQASNPDSTTKLASEAEYIAFRDWAIKAYGLDAWREYRWTQAQS